MAILMAVEADDEGDEKEPGRHGPIVPGEANDGKGQRQEEGEEDGDANEARIGLAGQHEFEADRGNAHGIGQGEPARGRQRAIVKGDEAEGAGENQRHQHVDAQNEGGRAHSRRFPKS
jgi:hypothetical protein